MSSSTPKRSRTCGWCVSACRYQKKTWPTSGGLRSDRRIKNRARAESWNGSFFSTWTSCSMYSTRSWSGRVSRHCTAYARTLGSGNWPSRSWRASSGDGTAHRRSRRCMRCTASRRLQSTERSTLERAAGWWLSRFRFRQSTCLSVSSRSASGSRASSLCTEAGSGVDGSGLGSSAMSSAPWSVKMMGLLQLGSSTSRIGGSVAYLLSSEGTIAPGQSPGHSGRRTVPRRMHLSYPKRCIPAHATGVFPSSFTVNTMRVARGRLLMEMFVPRRASVLEQ
mmetsp:Transcript_18815/g.71665  ORF Transcript_18815/g.71665 Transcript_18815/m.71665 type:complete len:279 (+) Transcript_18815:3599-4435(+)